MLGNVGVNGNYLSHVSNSVISFSLAIRFTEDVVIPRNRATDAPVYPNFRTATLQNTFLPLTTGPRLPPPGHEIRNPHFKIT